MENGGGDDDDDDDIDLFGSDEEDEEAERIKQERLEAYAAKKAKKPALIAKSSILLDVKPVRNEFLSFICTVGGKRQMKRNASNLNRNVISHRSF